jgi:hypothetical protein
LVRVELWLSEFVTTTLTVPAAWAPVVAEIFVEVTLVTAAEAPPMETDKPERKLVPEIETEVPPPVDPVDGAIALTEGGGEVEETES